jgi:tetratricopeptide (TPR) repeat protein
MEVSHSEPPSLAPAPARGRKDLVQDVIRSAEEHYQAGDFARARQFLQLLDSLAAHTAETLQTAGNLSLLLGEFELAGEALHRALALRPDDASLLVSLALVDFRRQNHPNINGFLARALLLEPENLEALKLLADWHLSQGRITQAAPIYGKLIQKDPRRVEICLCLAKCFFETGDRATAESTLEYALQLEPDNELARENLAALRRLRTQPQPAAPLPPKPVSDSAPVIAGERTGVGAAWSFGSLPGVPEIPSEVLAAAATAPDARVLAPA